jgi:glycolate oxidase FAD binding subunit
MTTAASEAVSRLAEISGASNVVTDSAQLAGYGIDGMTPSAAVKPGTRDEICEIVKFCAAEKLAIVPCGGRSKLSMGGTPARYDVAVDATRLDRIVAYDPSDLTLSVEPGIPLQRLAGVLAGHRQFLPLAVPFLGRATAGGTIASGVHSPLRQMYGTARDFLLGVEFVTGEGSWAKSGGLVVKNVAGYDLHKLMIGAMGTLGIITKLNFRTFPAPRSPRVFSASFGACEAALELRRSMMQSPLRMLTLDILNPDAVRMLSDGIAARFEPGPDCVDAIAKDRWAVLAAFSGFGAVLNRYQRELEQMAKEAGCEGCEIAGEDTRPASFGRVREFVPIALESSAATVILKLSVLPTKVGKLLAAVVSAAQASGLRFATDTGGLGVSYVALLPDGSDEDWRGRARKAADDIESACAQLGGNVTIPWAPGKWKSALKMWGPERAEFAQMRELKKVFDPAGILAPGRFAGGI